jgi:adenylosuccinate lyase
MRCERICSLARHLMTLPLNAAHTEATQWFERTLDDSANRRIVLPEAFLSADIILSIVANVVDGVQVWPKVIAAHIAAELPFMATENILMAAVRAGGDRQTLHEAIRAHSMEAGRRVKAEGVPNDLIERLSKDPLFAKISGKFEEILDPSAFVGRAPGQVDSYISEVVKPLLARIEREEGGAFKAAEEIKV